MSGAGSVEIPVEPDSRAELPAALQHRDPDYVRRSLPITWPLISAWFRPDIHGLERIPVRGPALMVGNHSGGNVAPDTLAFTLAFYRRFGAERPFFQLAHHLVMRAPWLSLLRKYGTIEATWENAQAAVDAGAAVLVYPGATGRHIGPPGTVAGSSSRGARDSPAWRWPRRCRLSRWSRSEARRRRCSSRAGRV